MKERLTNVKLTIDADLLERLKEYWIAPGKDPSITFYDKQWIDLDNGIITFANYISITKIQFTFKGRYVPLVLLLKYKDKTIYADDYFVEIDRSSTNPDTFTHHFHDEKEFTLQGLEEIIVTRDDKKIIFDTDLFKYSIVSIKGDEATFYLSTKAYQFVIKDVHLVNATMIKHDDIFSRFTIRINKGDNIVDFITAQEVVKVYTKLMPFSKDRDWEVREIAIGDEYRDTISAFIADKVFSYIAIYDKDHNNVTKEVPYKLSGIPGKVLGQYEVSRLTLNVPNYDIYIEVVYVNDINKGYVNFDLKDFEEYMCHFDEGYLEESVIYSPERVKFSYDSPCYISDNKKEFFFYNSYLVLKLRLKEQMNPTMIIKSKKDIKTQNYLYSEVEEFPSEEDPSIMQKCYVYVFDIDFKEDMLISFKNELEENSKSNK